MKIFFFLSENVGKEVGRKKILQKIEEVIKWIH